MKHLAIDIGAESGRAVLGWIDSGRLETREVHRFPNKPLQHETGLYWDIDALIASIRESVDKAGDIDSVGVDTWAVDYVLLDENGQRLGAPFHYRDRRSEGMMDQAFTRTPAREIYKRTGIQLLPFNSLYQLLSESAETLNRANLFLTIPDYLNHVLTGAEARVCEFTNATTTQCFDPRTGDWSDDLIAAQGLPRHIFPKIAQPGTIVGAINGMKVVAPACHDTGSAVAAIPMNPETSTWISSGTWSILGFEVAAPVINGQSFEANFTNEGGVGGTYRFSKNVAGLWLVQQCRAAWGKEETYEGLMRLATEAKPNVAQIDPDDADYFAPGDMPARINAKLATPIQDPGQLIRIIVESLARRYAEVIAKGAEIAGRKVERIHVVGGGSQNRLLNQLTADACGVPVVAGPVEATALGNLAMQMIALGQLGSIEEARDLIGRSTELETFTPCQPT